jgi:hypothetical protein
MFTTPSSKDVNAYAISENKNDKLSHHLLAVGPSLLGPVLILPAHSYFVI